MLFTDISFPFFSPLTLISELPSGASGVLGLFGRNKVIIEGPVAWAWLGDGNDRFKSFGAVEEVDSGSGNDRVTLLGETGSVDLGTGKDRLEAWSYVEDIDAGTGRDRVTLYDDAGQVDLGAGRDLLVVEGFVETADGGRGKRDVIDFGDREAGAFDILSTDDGVVLKDRFTAQQMEVTGFESFEFADSSYTLEELAATFAADAPPVIQVSGGTQAVTVNNIDPTVSVIWDRVIQQAVIDTEEVAVGPTVAARAYAMMHTAMYDAWASYDPTALRISLDGADDDNVPLAILAEAASSDAAKEKAMSYAAVTVLQALFPDQEALIRAVMEERLGHTLAPDGSLEAQVGVDAAEDLLALRLDDGSNQTDNYRAGEAVYTPVNVDADSIIDITRWTPESVPIDSDGPVQSFLTPQWGGVESFALAEDAAGETDHADHRPPPPQPFFSEAFADATLDMEARTISHDGNTFAVSKDLIGTVINPDFIAQAEEVVAFSANLTDEEKVIAEFAEDGLGTAFPPGTFMSFAQYVSARDDNDLDTDAKLFVSMANAMLDAAVSTWEAKTFYDYARPVRVIRDLGELGLIGEFDADLGGYAIEAFAGPGLGTQTILAKDFITFQRFTTDPSPPFAEYTSGHSAFSAAGAEVLKLFTGSDDFGAAISFAPGSTQFEPGVPGEEVVLDWQTFSDAADMNGLSRLFGGIHFVEGDLYGRALGRQVGEQAHDLAQSFFDGTATDADRPFWAPTALDGDGFDFM